MNFENLLQKQDKLIQYMQDAGYSEDYIRPLRTEINWLRKNGEIVDSYEAACRLRESQTKSPDMQRRYRAEYGLLKRFDVCNIYPDYRRKEPFIKRSAYDKLNIEFKEVVDACKKSCHSRNLKHNTVKGKISLLSCFLLSMQEMGAGHLSDIAEEDAMSFFTDASGNVTLSDTYRKEISLALKENLGRFSEDAKKIESYLPKTRPRRKNIQYLQPEEVECIHEVLDPENPSRLTLRNKAIAALLLFTGLRACDISALTLDEIDWENDEIRLTQDKTDAPLTLPLTAMVGNALYDYITSERPRSEDRHIFLGESRPHDPLKASNVYLIVSKIFDAATVRTEKGIRRGSHLFRYNAATTYVSNGISRPVASAALGHEDPSSLDYYTFADIKHLRECALSIEKYPIRKGVFEV